MSEAEDKRLGYVARALTLSQSAAIRFLVDERYRALKGHVEAGVRR